MRGGSASGVLPQLVGWGSFDHVRRVLAELAAGASGEFYIGGGARAAHRWRGASESVRLTARR